jgi:hypothetical protein
VAAAGFQSPSPSSRLILRRKISVSPAGFRTVIRISGQVAQIRCIGLEINDPMLARFLHRPDQAGSVGRRARCRDREVDNRGDCNEDACRTWGDLSLDVVFIRFTGLR